MGLNLRLCYVLRIRSQFFQRIYIYIYICMVPPSLLLGCDMRVLEPLAVSSVYSLKLPLILANPYALSRILYVDWPAPAEFHSLLTLFHFEVLIVLAMACEVLGGVNDQNTRSIGKRALGPIVEFTEYTEIWRHYWSILLLFGNFYWTVI